MSQKALADSMRSRGHKWSQATVWSVEQGERPLRYTEAQDLIQLLAEGRDVPLLEAAGDADLRAQMAQLRAVRTALTDLMTRYISQRWDLVDAFAETAVLAEDLVAELLLLLGVRGDVDYLIGEALSRAGAGDPRYPDRASDESVFEDGHRNATGLEDRRRLLFNLRLALAHDRSERYTEGQFDRDLKRYSSAELTLLGIDPDPALAVTYRHQPSSDFQQMADQALNNSRSAGTTRPESRSKARSVDGQ